jgi:hypothetical protein
MLLKMFAFIQFCFRWRPAATRGVSSSLSTRHTRACTPTDGGVPVRVDKRAAMVFGRRSPGEGPLVVRGGRRLGRRGRRPGWRWGQLPVAEEVCAVPTDHGLHQVRRGRLLRAQWAFFFTFLPHWCWWPSALLDLDSILGSVYCFSLSFTCIHGCSCSVHILHDWLLSLRLVNWGLDEQEKNWISELALTDNSLPESRSFCLTSEYETVTLV